MAVYHPVVDESEPIDTPAVLYLVSPEGARYQVLELDPWLEIELEQWAAGTTTAVVQVTKTPENPALSPYALMDLDLLSGSLVPAALPTRIDFKDSYLGLSPAGNELWQDVESAILWEVLPSGGTNEHVIGGDGAGGYTATLSPDHTRTAIGTHGWESWNGYKDGFSVQGFTDFAWGHGYYYDSLAGGGAGYAWPMQGDCSLLAWWNSSELTFRCQDAFFHTVESDRSTASPLQSHARVVTVGVGHSPGLVESAASGRLLSAEDPLPTREGAWVSDGLIVVPGALGGAAETGDPTCEETGAYLWDGNAFGELPASRIDDGYDHFDVASTVGLVYVEASSRCGEEPAPATLSVYDPATGETRVLLPPPPAADATVWVLGLRSWLLGD